MLMSAQDGKGTHKSLGRINLQTGGTVMPPWDKRTTEQKRASTHGEHTREHTGSRGEARAGGRAQGGTAEAAEQRMQSREGTGRVRTEEAQLVSLCICSCTATWMQKNIKNKDDSVCIFLSMRKSDSAIRV